MLMESECENYIVDKGTKEYECPVCKKGTISIKEERDTTPGFRCTDYYLVGKTCECDVNVGMFDLY